MILEVPTTGERIAARLVEHTGLLCLKVGPSEVIACVLKVVLDAKWRIIAVEPDERTLLQAHGLDPSSLTH